MNAFTFRLRPSVFSIFFVEHLGIGVCALFTSRLDCIGGIGGPPVFTPHPIDLWLFGRFPLRIWSSFRCYDSGSEVGSVVVLACSSGALIGIYMAFIQMLTYSKVSKSCLEYFLSHRL